MFKRILGVLGANAFGQGVNLFLRVATVPVFLHFWGKELYGEWIILLTIPTYLGISGSGIGNVTSNEMVMKISKGRKDETLSMFQSSWLFINVISVLFVIVSILIALIFPVAQWLNIHHVSSGTTAFALILLSFYTMFYLQGELLVGVYRANGTFSRGILFYHLITLLENIGLLISVALTKNILTAITTYIVIRILGTVVMGYVITRQASWFAFGIKKARLAIIRSSLLTTFSCMGLSISNALTIQGLVTIIGIRLGPASVVSFTVIRTLINMVKQLSSMIYYSVWPEFSTALATDNKPLARKLHRYACHITLLFALCNITFLLFFGTFIIRIWTNGQLEINYPFFILMLISLVPNTFWLTSSYVQVSINKFEKIALVNLLISTAIIVLTYFALGRFGLVGYPAIQILGDLIMLFIVVRDSLVLVNDSFSDFLQHLFVFDYVKKLRRFPRW